MKQHNKIKKTRAKSFLHFIITVLIIIILSSFCLLFFPDLKKSNIQKQNSWPRLVFNMIIGGGSGAAIYYLLEIIFTKEAMYNNTKLINLTLNFPMEDKDKKISDNPDLAKIQTEFNKLDQVYWGKSIYLQIFCISLFMLVTIFVKLPENKNSIQYICIMIFLIFIILVFVISLIYDRYNQIRRWFLTFKEKRIKR